MDSRSQVLFVQDHEARCAARADCPKAVQQEAGTGRWFITFGHPGFNSPANNDAGYASAAKARAAVRRYSA